MNQMLFDPADIEKVHTNRVDAFQSFRGPIGSVENHAVTFWRSPSASPGYRVPELIENIPIIKCYAGMDGLFIEASLAACCRGIVIEGLGSGNIQPAVVPALRRALERHIQSLPPPDASAELRSVPSTTMEEGPLFRKWASSFYPASAVRKPGSNCRCFYLPGFRRRKLRFILIPHIRCKYENEQEVKHETKREQQKQQGQRRSLGTG